MSIKDLERKLDDHIDDFKEFKDDFKEFQKDLTDYKLEATKEVTAVKARLALVISATGLGLTTLLGAVAKYILD